MKILKMVTGAATVAALMLGGVSAAYAQPTPENGTELGGTEVTVPAPAGLRFKQVISSGFSTSALTVDNELYAWGFNGGEDSGSRILLDPEINHIAIPTRVTLPDGLRFTELVPGQMVFYGKNYDGDWYAWGNNAYGQLGDGNSESSYNFDPVKVLTPENVKFTQISAGGDHTLALADNGDVYAWGRNNGAQLGNGNYMRSQTPVRVHTPENVRFTQVAASSLAASYALAENGKAYVWGMTVDGTFGDGTDDTRYEYSPIEVTMPEGVGFTKIVAATSVTLALGDDGKTYSWGRQYGGTLGISETEHRLVPKPIETPAGIQFTDIRIFGGRAIAIGDDGNLYAWGGYWFGGIGNGNEDIQPTPVRIPIPGDPQIASLQICSYMIFVTDVSGVTYAWGGNQEGGLGIGTFRDDRSFPVRVNDLVEVTAVKFDGVEGHELVDNANGTVSVVTPPHAPGAVDVQVEWSLDGVPQLPVTYRDGYTYEAADTPPPFPAPEAPAISDPANVTVKEGKDAKFSVTVTGKPQPSVSWEVSKDSGKTWKTVQSSADGVASSGGLQLTVRMQKNMDGYRYRATATNPAGSATSAAASLILDVTNIADPCLTPRKNAVFLDVSVKHQFFTEIDWMECKKYTRGIRTPAGREYWPKVKLSREAMAAFMYRYESPKGYVAPKVSPFADMKPGDPFYTEISWMWEAGLSTGIQQPSGKPIFAPKQRLSREAMAAFLYRFEKTSGYVAPRVSPFEDMKPGDKFYREVNWMYSRKLSTGMKTPTGIKYAPLDRLSREAMAAFMYRYATKKPVVTPAKQTANVQQAITVQPGTQQVVLNPLGSAAQQIELSDPRVSAVSAVQHGAVATKQNGTTQPHIVYTPEAGWSGTETINVTVENADGGHTAVRYDVTVTA